MLVPATIRRKTKLVMFMNYTSGNSGIESESGKPLCSNLEPSRAYSPVRDHDGTDKHTLAFHYTSYDSSPTLVGRQLVPRDRGTMLVLEAGVSRGPSRPAVNKPGVVLSSDQVESIWERPADLIIAWPLAKA